MRLPLEAPGKLEQVVSSGGRFVFRQTTKAVLPGSPVRARTMFMGSWLSHHALTYLVSPSRLLRAAGAWRALVTFTSSLANNLRAPLLPFLATRLREALASVAEPGTYRKVGHEREMAEVGLPTVRT